MENTTFENEYAKSMILEEKEKTKIDKIVDRQDSIKFLSLIKKENPTKEDFLEMQELITGMENKFLDLDDNDSWVLSKIVIRIIDRIELISHLYDFKKTEIYKKCNKEQREKINLNIDKTKISTTSHFALFNFMRRSSLSRNGTAFKRFTDSPMDYPYNFMNQQTNIQPEKKGIIGRIFGR